MRGPSLPTFYVGPLRLSSMQTPLARVIALTSLAMIAFAGNSLLCRIALTHTTIDAATFTTIRLMSGAAALWLVVRMRRGTPAGAGNWASAFALFVYAAGLSFAYVRLPAATGALLLFGAVQATMIGYGICAGERLAKFQLVGLMLALGGLVGLLLPGFSAPPLYGSVLMLSAGVAWGIYSLSGKGKGDPTRVTAGNFLRAVPIAATLSLVTLQESSLDLAGFWCAALSGALASGAGYVVWYTALPALKAANAATVQLSVPVIAAVGGVLLLGEPISLRMILASVAILGGIALVIVKKHHADGTQEIARPGAVSRRGQKMLVVRQREGIDFFADSHWRIGNSTGSNGSEVSRRSECKRTSHACEVLPMRRSL